MIIVEGADNVGKTTLIQRLLQMNPSMSLLRRERFKPGMEGTIGQTYINALLPPVGSSAALHVDTLADRFFISECIYGTLFRDGCRMTEAEHFTIRALLQRYRAIIVWCDTSDGTIQANWDKRSQLYDRDPLAIAHAYRARMPLLAREFPCFTYDWTSRDASVLLQRIQLAHRQSLALFHAHEVANIRL